MRVYSLYVTVYNCGETSNSVDGQSDCHSLTYAYILVGTFLYIMCMFVCVRESTSVCVCVCVREREY